MRLPDGARWRYRYDAFGRRISKVCEGQAPSAQAVARVAYRWDGDQLSGQTQYRADGSVARAVQWVYEPGSFRPLAQVEEKGERTQLHYIVTDLTGTARELCSETGEVHWRGEQGLWDAHREEKIPVPLRRWLGDAANEEVYCELRYQGQVYDSETGLYYNRHRYYDPTLVQYISADPIGLAGGLRAQGYVHNPMEWVDPFGLSSDKCPQPNKSETKVVKAKSRRDAITQAKDHAQVPRVSKGGQDIEINRLNEDSRGENWSKMKSSGATKLGRENPQGKNYWFEHPDGHPDAGQPNIPEHHGSGHVHAVNPKGEKVIFVW
nr:RHS repeat-associated core domain-containing protein [Dickeya zeae]